MTVGRRTVVVTAVATVVAAVAFLASLWFSWAVVDGSGSGFFGLIARSSGTTALLGVLFLLSTLVAWGLTGAALLSAPAHRWYAALAALAALLDLGVTAGIGYRLTRADGIGVGTGWYLATAAALATCAAVSGAVAGVIRTRRESSGG